MRKAATVTRNEPVFLLEPGPVSPISFRRRTSGSPATRTRAVEPGASRLHFRQIGGLFCILMYFTRAMLAQQSYSKIEACAQERCPFSSWDLRNAY
jgi:hypothetical protein